MRSDFNVESEEERKMENFGKSVDEEQFDADIESFEEMLKTEMQS